MESKQTRFTPAYVLCIERGEYRADLQIGKVYRTFKPERRDPEGYLRIVDESGEDYLFPASWFVEVDLPRKAQQAIAAASS